VAPAAGIAALAESVAWSDPTFGSASLDRHYCSFPVLAIRATCRTAAATPYRESQPPRFQIDFPDGVCFGNATVLVSIDAMPAGGLAAAAVTGSMFGFLAACLPGPARLAPAPNAHSALQLK
jgi:hypothetical protein